MNWFVFALISALVLGLAVLVEKKTLFREHSMEFASVLALFNALLSVPLLWNTNWAAVTPAVWWWIALGSVMATGSFFLVTRIVRHMEVSESGPLLALGPAFTAVFALGFLGEALSLVQVCGLATLIAGAYLLEVHQKKGAWHPIQVFKKSAYAKIILVALVLYGLGSVIDRWVLTEYQIPGRTYLGIIQIFVAINFLILIFAFHDGWRGIRHGLANAGWLIFAVAVLTVIHRWVYLEAASIASIGLVAGIKRSSILVTTAVGGEIFHEHNLKRKVSAVLIMLLGIFLLLS